MDQTASISNSFAEKLDWISETADSANFDESLTGFKGASKALFLSRVQKRLKIPILVLASDQNHAEKLLGEIRYFVRHEKIKRHPIFFPSWELLPFEPLSPSKEISGERIGVLKELLDGEAPFVIAPVDAAIQHIFPKDNLKRSAFSLIKGENTDREAIETCLIDCGYARFGMVDERGQYSSRGDILDIFVPSLHNPVRIEFFGDEIESIRLFDVGTQTTIREIESLNVIPVRELCLTPETLNKGFEKISKCATELNSQPSQVKELKEKFENLGRFPGMEVFSSFFYSEKNTLLDYFPPETLIVFDEPEDCRGKVENTVEIAELEYEKGVSEGNILPSVDSTYITPDRFKEEIAKRKTLNLRSLSIQSNEDPNNQLNIRSIPPLTGRFEQFAEWALKYVEEGYKVQIVAPTKGHATRGRQLLEQYGLEAGVDIGTIGHGFVIPEAKTVFIAEHEVFGKSHKHKYRRKPKSMSFQRGFKDLKPGDYLVHIDYGIGRYLGTKELETGIGGGEFLDILYAGNEKLYIPMDGLAFIQKYVGTTESPPPLDKLGGVSWKRQKNKIKESIREMAEDLLKLYAKRELADGKAFQTNPVLLQEFADSFDYVETDDQMKAIEEVYEDLENEKPMDRLVCGDVGFGKTEVAMRAAFKVAIDGKQVAVLAPTTLLAQQHYNTFCERFKAHPLNIEMISRFRSAKEQKEILEKLKNNQVDIIIGTHKLLGDKVKFPDLGLIVIDEEQRFGVKHKEKLKKLRASVDILTLTATPIPRTLYFSLMGVRDLSVIETPPEDRLAIKTYIRRFEESIIREAISRELERGGQVYFIHNKIFSINSVAEMLLRIFPNLNLGIAHGRLPEKELEKVMKKFVDKEIDVLLCTTIVENGIDIPSANTIIINRADQFGLGQLYQLRGRVGRYKNQAYAYLLIPGFMTVTEEARKRLSAIEELTELGAGFQLASRDLEIRGAGNMLGNQQSGHVNTIGFDLYCKLIEDTVKELRGQKVEAHKESEVDFKIKGFIPKYYISDLNQRLEFYRRLYLANDLETAESLEEELVDRFGTMPDPVEKLTKLLEIKILCQKLDIIKVDLKAGWIYLEFDKNNNMPAEAVVNLLDKNFKFDSEFRLKILSPKKGWKEDLQIVKGYLIKLGKTKVEN